MPRSCAAAQPYSQERKFAVSQWRSSLTACQHIIDKKCARTHTNTQAHTAANLGTLLRLQTISFHHFCQQVAASSGKLKIKKKYCSQSVSAPILRSSTSFSDWSKTSSLLSTLRYTMCLFCDFHFFFWFISLYFLRLHHFVDLLVHCCSATCLCCSKTKKRTFKAIMSNFHLVKKSHINNIDKSLFLLDLSMHWLLLASSSRSEEILILTCWDEAQRGKKKKRKPGQKKG